MMGDRSRHVSSFPPSAAALLLALAALAATPASARIATGSYLGDGNPARIVSGLDFAPAAVIIKGDLAEPAIIRCSTMPVGLAKPLALELAPPTGRITTLTDSGFLLGDADAVNREGIEYRWVALGEQEGFLVCGGYAGDGSGAREIGGLGFEPGLVLLIPGDDARCRFRTDAMPAGVSAAFDDVPLETGLLTDLTPDGFVVQDDPRVNAAGTDYWFVAVARSPGRSFFGAYLGDGSTNRVIGEAGFTPQWVLVKSSESKPGAHLTTELSDSGRCLNFHPAGDFADGIRHLTGQGFAIGGHEQVNEPDKIHHYAVFADDGYQSATADLSADLAVDTPSCEEGESFSLTAVLRNDGPDDVPGARLRIEVPADLLLLEFAADPGQIDDASTPQTIDLVYDLSAGQQRQATATYRVEAGAALRTFAALAAAPMILDPDTANNGDTLTVAVPSADLAIALASDDPQPEPGRPFLLTATLSNQGPDPALGPSVALVLPPGLTIEAAAPSTGVFEAGTGIWLPGLQTAGEAATLDLTATVAPQHAGQELTVTATAHDPRNDPSAGDNEAALTLAIGDVGQVAVAVVPFAQEQRRLLPGGPVEEVLRLRLTNHGSAAANLVGIVFSNPVTGSHDQADQDALWSHLQLRAADGPILAEGVFQAGRFTAAALDLALAGGDSLDLALHAAAAIDAPDGTRLQPAVTAGEDLVFSDPVGLQAAWPLTAAGTLTVDGMTAAQITLHPVGPVAFQMGSVRNLALDALIPGNGGQPDVLTKLNVVNLGDAAPGSVVVRVEAWSDDGDGQFNAAADERIGTLHWTGGDRWEASALAVPIAAAGLRIFVTVDIAADAIGGTVRLSLPAGDDVAINVASGNDGPIDEPVSNPYTQTVTASDRIVVTTAPIASRTVSPGEDRVPLLHLVARNLYDQTRTLRLLQIHNLGAGADPAAQADIDGAAAQIFLHLDGDGDGRLDGPDVDPVAGTAIWQDGLARFDNLDWTLPPDEVGHLFVTVRVSLLAAADGDTLGAAIGAAGDLLFRNEAAIVASWPLDSGARHAVRGMVAAQVDCREVPPISLAAGDGPALAFDVTVPGNGYRDDVLQDLRLTNLGSADAADIASLAVWSDDGDGHFDPATDQRLVDLTPLGQDWIALDLDLAVPAAGRRLFAGLTVTETPADSATVSLAFPVGGLTMQSTNDGPRDAAVVGPTTLLISTAPLLASFDFDRPHSTTEMTVVLRQRVANVGGEEIQGIVPSPLQFHGAGQIALLSGPQPASLDLASGAVDTFTWLLAAEAAGSIQAVGSCSGTGAVGGQTRQSLTTTSPVHRIHQPAADLGLYPVANMPFSINRGQVGVVPLTLTLLNDGGPQSADLRLERLVVTLDDGDGGPIAPADLLDRVIVNEGVLIYCDQTAPESAGQTLTLALQPPVVVTASEPVTLSLRLDIRPDPLADRFRVGLLTAADVDVVDAISGQPRTAVLASGGFPVQSAVGTIVARATELLVDAVPLPETTAGPGQDDVELLRLSLEALGEDQGSEVKVGALAVVMRDGDGAAPSDPAARWQRLTIRGPQTEHAVRPIAGPSDTLVVFTLTPQITVPVGTQPLAVSILGRAADQPPPGRFRLHLAAPQHVDARDGNMGTTVPIAYRSDPIAGPLITLQDPAPALLVAVTPRLAPNLAVGTRNVVALDLAIRHPGPATSGSARLDTLRLAALDGARRPLDPRTVLDGCRAVWSDGDPVAAAHLQADGVILPLGRRPLAPGDEATLTLSVDIHPEAASGTLELLLTAADGLRARDANLETLLAIQADDGAVLPGGSGVANLQPASLEVVAAWQDRLPALLPADDRRIEAARLTLTNPAPAGSAPLELTALVLRAAARDGSPLAAGTVLDGAAARTEAGDWCDLASVAVTDTTLILAGAEPLLLPAASSQTLVLLISARSGVPADGLRLGCLDQDLVCRHPGGAEGGVVVRPASGHSFPFWTAAGGLAAADLAASYLNYPNPFAAGREQTTFAFNLPRPGRVSLKLWTPRGDVVAALLRQRSLEGGLHQDTTWDGRNERGQTVVNGVYLAELIVEYLDGGRERLWRKVAVAR